MIIQKEILDNGIELYKIPIKNTKRIGIAILINIGSIYEDKEYRGISHFLEHMMFKSNKKYSYEQIDLGLELNGGIANAATSSDYTIYFVECINNGFEKIVDILYSMFENNKFLDEEFEKEKKVIISEIERINNDPESKLTDILIKKSLFGDSDYGDPIGGYKETIENITKDILEEFKERFYVPKNISIFLEGNIRKKNIEIIKKYFSKLEGDNFKLKNPNVGNGGDIIEYMNTNDQIYFSLNFSFDIDKFFDLETLSEILSGGISSKTFQIFRNKYGIGYNISLDILNVYPDRVIYSLLIPGFHIEKEKILYKAIEDFIDSKVDEEYIKGRLKRLELIFETIKTDVFKRIYQDPILYKKFGIVYDDIFKIIKEKSESFDDLKKYLEKLVDGYEVWIKPK